jgi:HD-GYP domain-containing protein (c-di-GMP phosphodiesterase class II)
LLVINTGGIKSSLMDFTYVVILINLFNLGRSEHILSYGLITGFLFFLASFIFAKSSNNAGDFIIKIFSFLIIAYMPYYYFKERENRSQESDSESKKVLAVSQQLAEKSKEKEAELAQKKRSLLNLIEVAREMGSTIGKSDLNRIIVSKAVELLNVRIGFLLLIEGRDNKFLKMAYSAGIMDLSKKLYETKVGTGLWEKITLNADFIKLSSKNNEDAELIKKYFSESREIIRNILAVPLVVQQERKIIGVLGVANLLTEDSFNNEHLAFLKTLAVDAAMWINNRDLFMRLEIGYLELVEAMAKAVEARDEYTRGHVDRVAEYSVEVAKLLQLPQNQISMIKKAAVLHDLGKIGIRDAVLGKQSALNDEERKIMESHVVKSGEILKNVRTIEKAVFDAITQHHEKHDGSGYPAGLRGDQISLGAQIISVADTYDAMTTDRPYRKGLSREKALSILKEESGRQFAPKIVDTFITYLTKSRNINI